MIDTEIHNGYHKLILFKNLLRQGILDAFFIARKRGNFVYLIKICEFLIYFLKGKC